LVIVSRFVSARQKLGINRVPPALNRDLGISRPSLDSIPGNPAKQENATMAEATSTPAVKTVPKPRDQHLRDMADCIRFRSMDAVQKAKSGHPDAPIGMADIATVLFRDFMQFDAADPHWFDQDRFVLSNGTPRCSSTACSI
jgi:hypothetical protein